MLTQTEDNRAISQLNGTLVPYMESFHEDINEHFPG
jgi:hypothetical protein